ncbi:prepilin peptidase [Candidatus Woesearchaeota archaeon]|nr:prepilin peptidase [Candidatus Woesearchaeota archaeon]
MIELVFTVVAIIILVIAAIIDIKTKEVPNIASYSLIAIVLSLKLIKSIIEKNFMYFIYALIGLGIFLIVGLVLYYTKQWGGGDAKLLMGIGAAFLFYPLELKEFFNPVINDFPFILTILINIFIVGSIYSILWCIGILIKNKSFSKVIKSSIKDISNSKITLIWFTIIFLIIILSFFNTFGILLLIGTVLATITGFLLKIIKTIESDYLIKEIPIAKLTEGDWVLNEIKIKNKLIYKPQNTGISKNNILKLKKLKIKKVTIKEGIPFVPAIALGTIISIILGNLIFIIA